jgi:hypothetical protein
VLIAALDVENSDPEGDSLIEHDGENDLPKDIPEPLIPQMYPTTLSTKSSNTHPLFSKILEVVGFLQRDDSKNFVTIRRIKVLTTRQYGSRSRLVLGPHCGQCFHFLKPQDQLMHTGEASGA